MKPSRFVLLDLAMICVVGFSLWLDHAPRVATRRVSLIRITNSITTNQISFRLQNDEVLAIFVSEVTVKTEKSDGWLTFDQLVPADPGVLRPANPRASRFRFLA